MSWIVIRDSDQALLKISAVEPTNLEAGRTALEVSSGLVQGLGDLRWEGSNHPTWAWNGSGFDAVPDPRPIFVFKTSGNAVTQITARLGDPAPTVDIEAQRPLGVVDTSVGGNQILNFATNGRIRLCRIQMSSGVASGIPVNVTELGFSDVLKDQDYTLADGGGFRVRAISHNEIVL